MMYNLYPYSHNIVYVETKSDQTSLLIQEYLDNKTVR